MNIIIANTPICIFNYDQHFTDRMLRAQRRGYGRNLQEILAFIESVLSTPNHIARSRNAGGPNRWIYFYANNDPRKVVIDHSTQPPQFVTIM